MPPNMPILFIHKQYATKIWADLVYFFVTLRNPV
ncbi:hypothetical protein AFE_0116 [Acidithiobacillus ferrooxidans ATCC 23270]|uniref:Uncharacterized protein n=1 Tax=Acidithiobacillus ferrooxidans (strain ATCC 23270 / DSM 14882 / CIP 104768 / NCIMB 8455) TaxID=243159 RepID=B7J3L3_ACIF2|nr:hypothetical protein AFE_0116 [Acidithiobacillus ferrooxidans ATCC 23270]